MIFEKPITFFSLLADSSGRHELSIKIQKYFWPQLFWLAYLYRKFIINKVEIIVVVGSLGKTTTTATTRYLLGLRVKDKFESNAFGAVAVKVLLTSPFAKFQVIEVGIAKEGDMVKYAKMICPDVVVITSITTEHLENLRTIENIRNEKSKIFKNNKPPQLLIYNGDDPNVKKMVSGVSIQKKAFGFEKENFYCCTKSSMDWPKGYSIHIQSGNSINQFTIPFFGKQMIYCFLAAYSIAKEKQIPWDKILSRTLKIKPVNGRMQVVKTKQGAIIIRDEFKSSKESIISAYSFLNSIKANRKIIVQGKISHVVENQRQVFKNLGKIAGEIADYTITISSSDKEQAFSAAAKKAGLENEKVIKAKGNWKNVVETISNMMVKDDVILIKGSRQQKMERLSLALQGVNVKCSLKNCELQYIYCKDCSRLIG